jgi:hypothetical protein
MREWRFVGWRVVLGVRKGDVEFVRDILGVWMGNSVREGDGRERVTGISSTTQPPKNQHR